MATYKVCGSTQIGESHIQKSIVCQDFSYYRAENGIVVAAVADGLGSSKHSDVASRIAAKVVVDYCLEKLTVDIQRSKILLVLRDAFDEALFKIKEQANGALDDYDTTLSAAVFVSGDVYTGQVGDSAILGLREDGLFDLITQPQNGQGIGKEKPTYPLGVIEKWVFEKYQYKVKALFLATDGVLNKLVPPLLEDQKYPLDLKYLSYLFFNLEQKPALSMNNNWISNEVSLITPNDCNHDDKSLIIIISNDIHLNTQSDEYYQYPSNSLWSKLIRDFEVSLHPHRPIGQGNEQYHNQPSNPPPIQTNLPPMPPPSDTRTEVFEKSIPRPQKKRINKGEKLFLFISIFAILLLSLVWAKTVSGNSQTVKKQEAFSSAIEISAVDFIYDGAPHGLEIKIRDESKDTFKDAVFRFGFTENDYSNISSPQITNVKDSPLTVYYIVSCEGYQDIKDSVQIVISPFDFADLEVNTIENFVYSAERITPEIKASIGGKEFEINEEYNIKYKDNKNAGTATIIITPTLKNQNFIGEKIVTFTIEKALPTIDLEPEYKIDVSNKKNVLPTLNFVTGVNDEKISGTLEWFIDQDCSKTANAKDLPRNADEAVILYYIFTPDSHYLGNYNEIKGQVRFTGIDGEAQA